MPQQDVNSALRQSEDAQKAFSAAQQQLQQTKQKKEEAHKSLLVAKQSFIEVQHALEILTHQLNQQQHRVRVAEKRIEEKKNVCLFFFFFSLFFFAFLTFLLPFISDIIPSSCFFISFFFWPSFSWWQSCVRNCYNMENLAKEAELSVTQLTNDAKAADHDREIAENKAKDLNGRPFLQLLLFSFLY